MRVAPAPVGCRIVDSLPFSQSGTLAQAKALKTAGCEAVAGYLGVLNGARLAAILGAGMGYLPVTLAGEYNDGGSDEVAQLKNLQIPAGATVVADMEGLAAYNSQPDVVIARLTDWANTLSSAGYNPWLYVGVPQPLTALQLWKIPVRGYWRGQGHIEDKRHNTVEPAGWDNGKFFGCGWSMTQAYPSVVMGGVLVDVNLVGQDYKGRVPNLVYA